MNVSAGGSSDTIITDTVPSHAVHVQTFPAGTGMVTEEPQINPSTGEPYPDLVLDGQTYDNGGIQSLEQITLDQRANTQPLVGQYGDSLYLLTGDTGGRVVLSQFTPEGITNVQMTSTLPAHAIIPLNLATIFGGNTAPISLESYDGVQFTAVTQQACNSEYNLLSAVEVSPRVAAAVKASMPTKSTGKILLTQQFSQIIMHDYFAPFIENMLTYDESARTLFENNPDLAQQWATQRSDGVAIKRENPEIKSMKIKLGKEKISFITDRYSSVKHCVTGALNLSAKRKPKGLENSFNGAEGMADIYGDPVKYFGKAIQHHLPLTNNLASMGGAYKTRKK